MNATQSELILFIRWSRARGKTALCALICQDRGPEVNSLLNKGPEGHSILFERARKGFEYVATTLEDCFRYNPEKLI